MSDKIRIISIVFLFWAIIGCSETKQDQPWMAAIPPECPFVILHHDTDFNDVVNHTDMIALQEIASFRMDALSSILSKINIPISIKATALFPAHPSNLEPLFILNDPGNGLQKMAKSFQKPYAQNSYRFEEFTIYLLHVENQTFFSAQTGSWILVSKKSSAIENAIYAYYNNGGLTPFSDRELAQANIILNTPSLDKWVSLLGAPRYHPRFQELFKGTLPATLSIEKNHYDDPQHKWSLSGIISMDNIAPSPFVSKLTSYPANIHLDRYIPSDAAFISIYHTQKIDAPDTSLEQVGSLDSLLLNDIDLFQKFSSALSREIAFVAFEPSGFLSTGEHMFLRHVSLPETFDTIIEKLIDSEMIEENNNLLYANSSQLARLLGDPTGRFTDFYFMRGAQSVIVTRRAGLARRVDQDRRRRAVLYFDDDYMRIREKHPEQLSSWFFSKNPALLNYLDSYLHPLNHASFLTIYSEVTAASLISNRSDIQLNLDSYFLQDISEPVRELWAYPVQGGNMTGEPLVTNIHGGARKEMFLATTRNQVLGLASDGTSFFESSTGSDRPIGSPLVYDWYGNNQFIVLQAAGNKIYGWNMRGMPLPGFPITLDEVITVPIEIADVVRNGQPELIVATADRKIHVLNQRGNNVAGWPQEINLPATNKPIFHEHNGDISIWVTAGNALFAFSPFAERRDHFPVFVDSELGQIAFYNDHIIAGAADGHLYAIGKAPFFQDTLVVSADPLILDADDDGYEMETEETGRPISESIHIRKVYVGNAPIINAPLIQTLRVPQPEGSAQRETVIALQNLSGTLFLINLDGALRVSHNMGQPSASHSRPIIADVNGNGSPELLSTTSSGRLYGWNIANGTAISDIPTASMRYPVFTDILSNGDMELIAQTRDGIRCWSFRKKTSD